jgi:hypothetical protein
MRASTLQCSFITAWRELAFLKKAALFAASP